jgi:hypothetical protein
MLLSTGAISRLDILELVTASEIDPRLRCFVPRRSQGSCPKIQIVGIGLHPQIANNGEVI